MGKHSSTQTKGSILSALTALKPGKKRTGRHSSQPATAGGVLASVRSRPVLSAFVVPAAATAAVVGSSFAMVPDAAGGTNQVVAQSPVVVEAPAASPAADEALQKAEEQAKEKPAEISLEAKTQAPEPSPTPSSSPAASSSAETTSESSADENSGPSTSGSSAGTVGTCPMSYYGGGDGFDGRQTANGEIFDTTKLTAAHKSLPFGSQVKITNKANGKSVTVRINDRGPYSGARCFDRSKAAMDAVGGVSAGQINGSYEVL